MLKHINFLATWFKKFKSVLKYFEGILFNDRTVFNIIWFKIWTKIGTDKKSVNVFLKWKIEKDMV